MNYKTIYLTGAPASGKSSTLALLEAQDRNLQVWEYGARLTAYIQGQGQALADQAQLRSQSSIIVRPEHVDALDEQLIKWTQKRRSHSHVLIDSHPVTKEAYGFRVTAFSEQKIRQLRPDEIWVFYTSPDVALQRIRHKADGRPEISLEEARMHTISQAAVATTYGVLCGCPVYMFDTDRNQQELVEVLVKRLAV